MLFVLMSRTLVGIVSTDLYHPRLQGKYKCLHQWAYIQRNEFKSNDKEEDQKRLSKVLLERKRRLEELGFVSDVVKRRREIAWEEKFDLLKQYKEEYGCCKCEAKGRLSL